MKKIILLIGTALITTLLILNINAKGSPLGDYFFNITDKYFGVTANKKIIDDDSLSNSQSDSRSESVQASAQENNIATNKFSLENSTFLNSEGKRIIKDPNDLLVLVNKYRNLPYDWVPDDLVVPKVVFAFQGDSPRKLMREEAALALEELFKEAKKDNINIAATSGYRSAETQERIFKSNAKIKGEEEANKTSAKPGQSEHQTGLAMDITSASVNFGLIEEFGDTPEGRWLKENAAKFGFIIRYPKDKENITKYSYEPWHIRYVGKETAIAIENMGVTLEEYLNAVDSL